MTHPPPNLVLIGTAPNGSALFMVYPPVPCGTCKRAASMLVNMNGKTYCVECVPEAGTTPAR